MLKQLRINAKLKELRRSLKEYLEKQAGFNSRAAELQKALEEAENQSDLDLINQNIEDLDKEVKEADCESNIEKLNKEISEAEAELEEIGKPVPAPEPPAEEKERNDNNMFKTRGIFGKLSAERRNAILADSSVKEFITRARELVSEKRSVSGLELSIPVTLLDILKENISTYSKLYSHVNVVKAGGTTRRIVAGSVPEAIWTEMVGVINELSIDFSMIETDGFKVAGLFIIENSDYEDSDAQLLALIVEYLSAAVGKAIDKAIVYGTGNKMPLGFITRLAQTAQPSDWSSKSPEWTDLHTSHILKLDLSGATGEEFFSKLLMALAVADPKKNGANSSSFWVMNRKTHLDIIARTVKFNSAAALVASNNGTMPIVGGTIIEDEMMADYDIGGGYGGVYTLVERSGYTLAQSSEVKFIEDQTVLKGSARFDGKPAYAEGFVLINYDNTNPTTSIQFAADSANGDRVALSSLTIGSTPVTLLPSAFNKDVLNYHCTVKAHSQKITAAALDAGADVVIKNGNTVVNNGSNATFTAGENVLTVTVTNGNASARTYTVIVIDETA